MRVSADICHSKESMKVGLKYASIRIVQNLSSPAPEVVLLEVSNNHTHLEITLIYMYLTLNAATLINGCGYKITSTLFRF